MILSLIVFLAILGVLVFVHELGHFLVAKWTGMRVDEFALGFPPRVFGKRRGETMYAINALPLGGYVKIHGESAHGPEADPRAFPNRPIWARIAVIVAGVTMNLIFAFVLLVVAYTAGFPSTGERVENIPGTKIVSSKVVVTDVLADSPAVKAQIEPGDYIMSVKDIADNSYIVIDSYQTLIDYTKLQQSRGHRDLEVTLEQEGQTRTTEVMINADGPALGLMPDNVRVVRLPLWRAPQAAYYVISDITSATWGALKDFGTKLFVHAQLAQDVSGPVGIYHVTSSAARQGFDAVIFLTVALSVNLALLNILPIPALDGGKLVFLLTELVFRKRVVSEAIENAFSTFGFAALILLIVIITLRDVGLF